ncbi:MAG: chromosome segregation protein SMC [Armatimonadetes bacterium]|nr:chromosome segregation protein SMC [Armatimonadota bacterium]
MYLKRLEMFGFKTFAERTMVEFAPGVTSVVGPNGSGKSNICDALLWVIGEQNVRSLRALRTEDIIFAGSEKRRALGVAEVSLTIDNSSGWLPIEYSEVTITRRAYRSGENECFINKTPCRLKDIFELFLDTGVGREAYSIVNQNEVDWVITARPEERRLLLEEAAGIKKYRHRRKEALRKLEHTEQNLQRIQDIVRELERQLVTLERQAATAKHYAELSQQLKTLESGLLLAEWHRLDRDVRKWQQVLASSDREMESREAEIARLEAAEAEQSQRLEDVNRRIDGLQNERQEILTCIEQAMGQVSVIQEKEESARKMQAVLQDDLSRLGGRQEALGQEIEGHGAEIARLQIESRRLRDEGRSEAAELSEMDEAIRLLMESAEAHKGDYVEFAGRLAAQRNEFTQSQNRLDQLEAFLKRLESEKAAREQETALQNQAQLAHEEAITSLSSEREELEAKLQALAQTRQELEGRIGQDREAQNRLLQEMADRSSRRAAFQEMEENFEGYYQGVRTVLQAHQSGKLVGHYRIVTDLIEVPQPLETAVEVALGGSAQDIVTHTEDEARAAIEMLKRQHGGRATFLPLSHLERMRSAAREIAWKNNPDILGIASEMVSFESAYLRAVESLLGRVLVAQTLEGAVAAARRLAGWGKIVTLEGELLTPGGAITGGSLKTRGSLVSRKGEMKRLTERIVFLEEEAAALSRRLKTAQADLKEAQESLARLERRRQAATLELEGRRKDREHLQREMERLTEARRKSEEERKEAQSLLEQEQEKHWKLRLNLETLQRRNTSLDVEIAALEEQLDAFRVERERKAGRITQARVQLATTEEKIAGLLAARSQAERSIQDMLSQVDLKRSQLEELTKSRQSRVQQIEELESRLSVLKDEEGKLRGIVERERVQKQGILQEASALSEQKKAAQKTREDLLGKKHQADLHQAQAEIQRQQAANRLLQEYEVYPAEVPAVQAPKLSDPGASQTEIHRLKRQLRNLGNVNLAAAEEYAEAKERFDFLHNQKHDLEAARDDLHRAIKEIDASTRTTFAETFELVNAAFQQMFRELFGGGRTELALTDPEDILESGIEVVAQPPGKKLQNLALLSGGEKALTGLALLFALFKVKPSPFCVLDEVDAPLDDANVVRFASTLRQFTERSQFVVITHNRGTMELSDCLYGISMAEPGVSRILSVNLSDLIEAPEVDEDMLLHRER